MNSPAIRFAGFAEDWEGRSIDECFTERNERSEFGDLISVTMNFGVIKAEHLRRHDTSSDDKSNYKKVEVGDIAYNSMRMWQGASGHSQYSGILSPAYTVITPQEGTHSPFFAYLFKRPSMIQLFQINSQGLTSDTWNLKWPKLRSISVIVPEFKEQQHLSELFATIDSFITLHQREHDKSVNIKKALLEKMFPKAGEDKPEIRFAGFTDAWEQRKLGEITSEFSGYATLEAGLPLFTSARSGLMYQCEYRGNQTTDSKKTLFSVVPLNACTYRHMSDDDVFHMNINTLEKGLVSREYPVFLSTEGNDLNFIIQHLNSSSPFRAFCKEQKKGGTRTRLYYEALCEFTMQVPTPTEQKRISRCLLTLDDLLTLHQRELTKLQNIKKALLEKMFV